MSRRILDGLAVALLGLTAVVILTGGFVVPLGRFRLPVTRAEDVFLAALGVALLRHALWSFALRLAAPRRALLWGVALYSVLLSFITVTRHLMLRTHALDLGIYDQIMWSIANGLGPRTSLPDMHAWGDHLTFIQYPLALFYLVIPSVHLMLVLQSVALALGALAVYGLAKRRLGDDGSAALLGILFLVNPTLHGINIRDFHPQAMAIPLLLGAVYFFEANRKVWFWVFVVLALSCREDAALPVMGLGLWAATRRRYWTGAAVAALGLVWLFAATTMIIPYFRGEPYSHLRRYDHLGNTVAEILLAIVLKPVTVLSTVLSVKRLVYLVAILVPFAFLPLLAPLALLPALPALLENLLGWDPVLFHHRNQYNSFILPFLAVAAVLGWQRLLAWKGVAVARTALGVALLLSLALTSRTLNDLMVTRWWPGERERAAHALLARVPPLVPISAEERFIPHLSHRPKAWVFPTALEQSEYVLVDSGTSPVGKAANMRLTRDGARATLSVTTTGAEYRYQIVAEGAKLLLLRRTGG